MYSRGACAGETGKAYARATEATNAAPTWAADETEVFAPICAAKFREMPGCGSRRCSREPPLVEAGGQYIHGFRRGLDYAFIRPLIERMDAERVIPLTNQLDPSARPGFRRRRVYESLQGRPEVGLLPTPRRCHAIFLPKDAVRFHRCELRYQPTLAGWRDPRSNPRPQALDSKTYVHSSLFVFSHHATRGAGKTLCQPQ